MRVLIPGMCCPRQKANLSKCVNLMRNALIGDVKGILKFQPMDDAR